MPIQMKDGELNAEPFYQNLHMMLTKISNSIYPLRGLALNYYKA
jgi:hypothetical protein